jgi:tRNA-specific 2-thiouridylase
VRETARRHELVTADKPESQEICFIPDDYRGSRRRIPAAFKPGPIVDGRGAVLGRHAASPTTRSGSAAAHLTAVRPT